MNRKLNTAIALFLFLLLPLNVFAADKGKVLRQGRTNHSSLITFKLKNPGEAAVVQTYNVTTASDGSYAISDVPAGIYNLSAKASNSLSQNQLLIEVSEGQTTPNINFNLRGGDANNDNSVATADMLILKNAWLTREGQPKYDPRADFNGDKSIGTADMLIMQSNWLKNGIEPQVTITSPQEGILTSTSPITVSGTTDSTLVTVNGITATVANNTFTTTGVSLTQGQNKISAIATNSLGNKSADIVSVVFDTIAPVIAITSPQNGSVSTTQPITVSGTIDDNQAAVTVNGSPASVSSGTFSCSGITLTQGQNTIVVTATDPVGNTSSASITVTYQPDNSGDTTPPNINIYTPEKDSTTRSNIIYGRVSDDTVRVTVNGIDAELANSTFIARPTLTEGQNTVTVKAWDAAGNLGESQISFAYNTATPKVTITSPLNNSTQNISPINVQGTNTQDIRFILVDTATALIDNTNFSAEWVTLDTTKTVITATGYDANSNKFQDVIVVNSPDITNYELNKVSGDIAEGDPNSPSAGSNQILKAKLDKNDQPAPNEEIQFRIIQGNGALSSTSSFTDINGEAQVTLTTNTNSDITNQVECYPTSNPLVKTTFSIDTKAGQPSILTKITDDSIIPVPGVTIPLIVKLTDLNNNPIQRETINFQITQGTGTLSSPTAVTTYYGEAKVNLTCPNLGLVLTQVQTSSQTVPSVTATFNITTSSPLTVTVDELFNKVKWNAAKIQDQIVEVTVTSNDQYRPAASYYKTWQKGTLFKAQDLSTGEIYIRPQLTQGATSSADIQIISYNSNANIYVVKTRSASQTEEKPYSLTYIDYSKGVITKTEFYYETAGLKTTFVTEMSNFIQLPNADNTWVYNTKTEKMYSDINGLVYTTTTTVTNQQVNVGLTEADFK